MIKYVKGRGKKPISEEFSVFSDLLAGYCVHDTGLQVKSWQLYFVVAVTQL